MRMPLPSFSWANGAEVWNSMLEKDRFYSRLRSEKMLERHPSLIDEYRTILLDWLSQVSYECKFHRETYHLALDFIDRYLSSQDNVGKLQLQLIGTTCLFLAAKMEEIHSPAVNEFADLTDGACSPEDIIQFETNVLRAINWDITPVTPNSWLNTYMQILQNLDKESDEPQSEDETQTNSDDENSGKPNNRSDHNSCSIANVKNDSFILPTTNGIFEAYHKRVASVVDLALLHVHSLRFPYSVLTAASFYSFSDAATTTLCTGYQYNDLVECIEWLRPFVETIQEIREPVFVASKGQATQMHNHIATVSLLNMAIAKIDSKTTLRRKRKECDISLSPSKPTTLLTPPRSTKKARLVESSGGNIEN